MPWIDHQTGKSIIVHGPQVFYEKSKPEDIASLKALAPQAEYYSSYFFDKNFQDFTETSIFTTNRNIYGAVSFREAIVVDDFSTFHQKLSYGNFPQNASDVLLYDYMAHSLIYHGVFTGGISDIVGKELVDKHTGLKLTISGILQSDFKKYDYIKRKTGSFGFEQSYLATLQSIFCKRDLIVELEKEKLFTSIQKMYLSSLDGKTNFDTNIKKIKWVDLRTLDFVSSLPAYFDYELASGFIMSKNRAADILGLDPSEITTEIADNFIKEYNFHYYKTLLDFTLRQAISVPIRELFLA